MTNMGKEGMESTLVSALDTGVELPNPDISSKAQQQLIVTT